MVFTLFVSAHLVLQTKLFVMNKEPGCDKEHGEHHIISNYGLAIQLFCDKMQKKAHFGTDKT